MKTTKKYTAVEKSNDFDEWYVRSIEIVNNEDPEAPRAIVTYHEDREKAAAWRLAEKIAKLLNDADAKHRPRVYGPL